MARRACGAVIVDEEILMVRHVHDGRDYWTLPGGHIEQGETPKQAAEREVEEETGLSLTAERLLFSKSKTGGLTYVFLMSEPGTDQIANLGHDPEQLHVPKSERMLQEMAWHSLASKGGDFQVSQVIEVLGLEVEDGT